MEWWKRVHWFYTSKCNEKCVFCFKPIFTSEANSRTLAEELVNGGIEQSIYTGGEPLLKNIEPSLEILNKAGIDISIHTNATLLTSKRIKSLTNLVDELAIPLDSTNRKTQEYLRGKDCLPQIKTALTKLQDQGVRIGIHTVATSLNTQDIPKIYELINNKGFDYWRIYEFNQNTVADRFNSVERFQEIQSLIGEPATESDGGVNCLFADFLLMEEKMSKYKDKRVQFVGVSDYNREPYFFLGPNGDAFVSFWFLQGKRKPIGNILKQGFEAVKKNAVNAYDGGIMFDEDSFIETRGNQPLWVRAAWEGNYFSEELEEVNLRYHGKFHHLSVLHLNRLKAQGGAPQDAELNYEYSPV